MSYSEAPFVVVTVAGAVDVTDVVTLRNEIARAIAETGTCQVVVDVSRAHHLGPRGLATLVDEKALLVRRGGDLHLVLAERGRDHDGLERLFHLYPSVEDALATLRAM